MGSIRNHFLLLSALIITVTLVIAGFIFMTLFSQGLERQVHEELKNHVNQLAAKIAFSPDGKLLPPSGLSDLRFDTAYGGLYWQIDDTEFDAQLRSRSLWDAVLALPNDQHDVASVHTYVLPGPDNTKVIVQERTLIAAAPAGARMLRLAVAMDQSVISSARNQFLRDMLPYLLALGILLLLGTHFQVKIGLRSLDQVSNALDDVKTRKTPRLEGRFPLEIHRLTDAVNDLLASRENDLKQARKRSGDLAHSLKTPLTVVRSNAEKIAAETNMQAGTEIMELADQMEASITHELLRSKLAPTASARQSDAEAVKIITDIVKTLKKIPGSKHLDWKIELPEAVSIAMDPHDLRELLGNIIENAGKWAKSTIWIKGKTAPQSDLFLITIDDDGNGIDAAKIATMMDHGKRFDEQTPGTGIGLSIVKEIIGIYSLPLTIQNRQTSGLTVSIDLPLAGKVEIGSAANTS